MNPVTKEAVNWPLPVGHLAEILQQTTGQVYRAKCENFNYNSFTPLNLATSTTMDEWRVNTEPDSECSESMEDILMSLMDDTHLVPGQTGNNPGLLQKESEGNANPYEYLLDSKLRRHQRG